MKPPSNLRQGTCPRIWLASPLILFPSSASVRKQTHLGLQTKVFLKRIFPRITGGVRCRPKTHCREVNFTQWASQNDYDKRRHTQKKRFRVRNRTFVPRVIMKPTSTRLRHSVMVEMIWSLDFDSGCIEENFAF